MSEFITPLERVIQSTQGFVAQFLKSDAVQKEAISIVEGFFYSNVIQNFKNNLTKKNAEEFKISNTTIIKINKEFKKLYARCKLSHKGANKGKIDSAIYVSFRKELKDIDKNSYKLLLEFEKQIDINSCKKSIREFKREIPKLHIKEAKGNDWLNTMVYEALLRSGKYIYGKKLENIVSNATQKILPSLADSLLQELKRKGPKMLKERRRYLNGFDKRLLKRWNEPIDLLEMFLVINSEIGEEYHNEHIEDASIDNDYLFDVLTGMQTKGCRVFWEILTLLKSGFPDAALSRWRTLHETAVISYFIAEHGQKLAKRFLDHEVVETYWETKEYQKHCSKLGYEPLTKKELKKEEDQFHKMCRKYKKGFNKRYGWIPNEILENKSFPEIEKSVSLDRFRPFYKMACNDIHSGAKGHRFKLGLLQDSTFSDSLLTGPSNYGLADPAQNAAISLYQITTTLLASSKQTTLDRLVAIASMGKLVEEICETFCNVQLQIETEDAEYVEEMDK